MWRRELQSKTLEGNEQLCSSICALPVLEKMMLKNVTHGEIFTTPWRDLFYDLKEVHQEQQATFLMAAELCRFEYTKLDNNGKTTRLGKWIKKGANIFYECGDDVKVKYKY